LLSCRDGSLFDKESTLAALKVSREKRREYWNHFIASWAIDRVGGGHGVTGPRLRKIRDEVMADDDFWWDIVLRHGGANLTPEQMQRTDPQQYEHCLGNFWGMIYPMLFGWVE